MISATASATDGALRYERADLGDERSGRRRARGAQAARDRSSSSSIAAAFSLWATGLAISRAVHTAIVLADHEVVLAQRRAGRGEVDDRLDQAGQRRELDRALDLDDLDLAPGALEVRCGDARILGGDADHAQPAERLGRTVGAGDRRDDHRAAAEAEVAQLVDVAAGPAGAASPCSISTSLPVMPMSAAPAAT